MYCSMSSTPLSSSDSLRNLRRVRGDEGRVLLGDTAGDLNPFSGRMVSLSDLRWEVMVL